MLFLCLKQTLEVLNISNVKEPSINEEIREPQVRVIDKDGAQLGLMSSDEALKIAAEKDLDLVLIAPQAKPPVCKIMDYGKYKFEQAKNEKKAKKNQKVVETKEIRMSLNIDTHDFNTKLSQAVKFLKAGNKVKVSVRFRRAREMSHQEIAVDLLNKFRDGCAEVAQVDKPAKLEGRNMAMFISPKVL
ncbi:MAG: translation initiation factor IF-3 [Oscillospiraceae bacterium]